MSAQLSPSNALGFPRPLTQLVKRTLTISNPNSQPIAFKVKTTSPKLYCVRPNSGKVEPGHSIEISVMLQALKEEPPLHLKCKDKFLIQSTLITPEKETLPLQDIWNVDDSDDEKKVFQQKLRVVYLPPEGQSIPEGDEDLRGGIPRHDAQDLPSLNGHILHPSQDSDTTLPPLHAALPPLQQDPAFMHEPPTPPADFKAAQETHHEEPEPHVDHGIDLLAFAKDVPPQSRSPPVPDIIHDVAPVTNLSPSPESIPLPDDVSEPFPEPPTHLSQPSAPPAPSIPSTRPAPPIDAEAYTTLLAKYNESLADIQRLTTLLASAPNPTSPAPTLVPELRRRGNRALSDDGSTVAGTEIGTMYMDEHIQQPEGVPLQVVVIIALGVFITTYLFF